MPPETRDAPRQPGRLKGRIKLAEDFDSADHQIADWLEQDG